MRRHYTGASLVISEAGLDNPCAHPAQPMVRPCAPHSYVTLGGSSGLSSLVVKANAASLRRASDRRRRWRCGWHVELHADAGDRRSTFALFVMSSFGAFSWSSELIEAATTTRLPPEKIPVFQGIRYEILVSDTLDLAERMRLALNGITGCVGGPPTNPFPSTRYACGVSPSINAGRLSCALFRRTGL